MKQLILPGSLFLLGTGVFGFLSFLGFSRELAPIWKARASREWPVANGRIIEASAFFWRDRKSPGRGRAAAGHVAHLRYEYSVHGQEHVGYRLRFTADNPELFADEQEASALIAPFKPGEPVQVYYEPTNPENATLRNTYKLSVSGIVYSLIFGVLALVPTALVVVHLLPGRKPGSAT